MSVAFFVRDCDGSVPGDPALPYGTALEIWRPRRQATVPAIPLDPLRLAVTVQDYLGLFADDRYAELSLWCASTRIHRLVVTPRWHRFPFMAPGDLQLGALWTHPAWRRRGLARLAMAKAHHMFAAPGQRFWYVADAANLASQALARNAGYRLVGEGRRTRPIGLAVLGQFRLDREPALA